MTALRNLALIALVLALSAASVAMTPARHQARAAGVLVLCTAEGTVSVAVDAGGQPTGPGLPCPDCTLALAAVVPGGPVLPLAPCTPQGLGRVCAGQPTVAAAPVFRRARAPPLAV